MLILFLPHRLRAKLAEEAALGKLINLVLLFIVSCTAFVVAFRFTEKASWGEASWQAWQTMTTVGYGNAPAATKWGRLGVGVFGLAGIAFLGACITAYFDWRAETRERRRMGAMENPCKNGYVIINFPGTAKFTALASELAVVEPNVPICVVDDLIEELPLSVTHLPKVRVHFVKGSLLNEVTYKRAGITEARSIAIFPQYTGLPESDATTRLAVEIIERLVPPTTKITHILVAPENGWLFKECRSTPIYEIEEVLLMVQECSAPQTATMIQSLLRNSKGENPRMVRPGRIVGWKWGRFVRACMEVSEQRSVIINPLGLITPEGPDPCPATNLVIGANDLISLIVRHDFEWERFENWLVEGGDGQGSHETTRPKATA
jgi:voltage-gated potassium channel